MLGYTRVCIIIIKHRYRDCFVRKHERNQICPAHQTPTVIIYSGKDQNNLYSSNTYTRSILSSIQNSGVGAASTSMYVPLVQPATQPQFVYIPAQTEQFVFFKQIHKIQHIIQTKIGGGGEQRSPRVSPREALRNPLEGPSEHHRDLMGILLESLYPMGHQKSPIGNPISTPWVFPWKAHRNPLVSSETDPLGTHWYPRNPMGSQKSSMGA